MTLDRWIPLNLGMLELRVKTDKDGLVLHVRWAPWLCWAQINTPSHGASPGLSALAWKRLCCTHRQGTELSDSSLLQLRQEKSPVAACEPQTSKLESMRLSKWEKQGTKQRGVKGSGCEELQPESENQRRSPKPHTWLDCKTFIP